MLAGGSDADAALEAALAQEEFPDYRQVTVVDAGGSTAVHSGANSLGVHTHAAAIKPSRRGNLLKDEGVITALLTGYADSASAAFEERLLDGCAPRARQAAKKVSVHSAGLVVVEDVSWPVTDLRVD